MNPLHSSHCFGTSFAMRRDDGKCRKKNIHRCDGDIYIFARIDTKQALNPRIRCKPTPDKCEYFLNRFTPQTNTHSHTPNGGELASIEMTPPSHAIKSNPTNQSHAFWLPFVCSQFILSINAEWCTQRSADETYGRRILTPTTPCIGCTQWTTQS